MREGTRATPVLERRLDEETIERAIAAAEDTPGEEGLRAGLEAAIDLAEADPERARAALWELRGDHATLARIEGCLAASPERATLAVGAAIQLADAELDSPAPDLRGRLPELLRWLEADW
jgi:hypothetical protein